MGGMVLETNMTEIFTRIDEQNKLERQEVGVIYNPIMSEIVDALCTIIVYFMHFNNSFLGWIVCSSSKSSIRCQEHEHEFISAD